MNLSDCSCTETSVSCPQQSSASSTQLLRRDIGIYWSLADAARRRDIFHVAFLLRCMLPADLVPYIMEAAEFLEITSASVLMRPTVQHSMEGSVILATPPIITKVRRRYPAQKVVLNVAIFGPVGDDRDKEGTWTRFTAGKARSPILKSNLDSILTGGDLGTSATQQGNKTSPTQVLPNLDLDEAFPRKEHTVIWDRDSAATPRYERSMIQKMQCGDQIKLVIWRSPYACRPEPMFISASISVYTKVVVV